MIPNQALTTVRDSIVATVVYWAHDSVTGQWKQKTCGLITRTRHSRGQLDGLSGYVVRGGEATYATGTRDDRTVDAQFVATVVRSTYGVPHKFAGGGEWL